MNIKWKFRILPLEIRLAEISLLVLVDG